MQSLFSDSSKIPQVLMTIIAFSLSDTFDTIGTFIGTGRRTGIFSKEDEIALEDGRGFKTKWIKHYLPMRSLLLWGYLWYIEYNNLCRICSWDRGRWTYWFDFSSSGSAIRIK